METITVLYYNPSNYVRVTLCRRADGQEVVVKEIERHSEVSLSPVSEEGRIAKSLSHPNICRVYSSEMKCRDNSYFLCIEMEKGDSDLGFELSHRHTAWSEEEIWNMLIQTVCGFRYAQTQNICHRDIKPHNILIQANGRVFIADFGTAKLVNVSGLNNHTLQGTPCYLSPELLTYYLKLMSGEAMEKPVHDPYRSDIYSLGVSFIEMVRLQFPMEMRNMFHLAEVTERTLAKLNCSEELKMVLGAMVEPEIAARPDFHQLATILEVICNCSLDSVQPMESNYSKKIIRTAALAPVVPSILTTLTTCCQICGMALELEHILMQCGHKFCINIGCLESLNSETGPVCPVCRKAGSLTVQEICLECRKRPSVWHHSVCGRGYCQTCSSAWKHLPYILKCGACKQSLSEQETSTAN